MSYTSIPDPVKLLTWVRAGGRCEFRGCNDLLWRDDLKMQAMNKAYLAHIVADKPGGPRGDPIESDRLKADPSNIMLLCDACHRRIDGKKTWHEYPVDLLQAMKHEHEERIERQTGIQSDMKTHILLFGTRIGSRRGQVSLRDASQAIVGERYPADDHGIIIDYLSDIPVNESDANFWHLVQTCIDKVLERYLGDKLGPTGKPLNHLSVFAIAPIPALVYLGRVLGDIVPMDVYQLHRNPHGWKWKELQDPNFRYVRDYPEYIGTESIVAVNLSLSGKIHASEIELVLGEQYPTYTLSSSNQLQDFLQAREQLAWFRYEWYQLLGDIRRNHGEHCEIHLFAAVPNSIAVEIGRAILPTLGLRIFVYNKYPDGFRFALEV